MLKNRIIPCLDIKDGRVVKGVNFEGLVDAGDPVAQAKFYYEQGADELCLLDITATSDDRGIILDVVREVAKVCFIPFTVGGGVREIGDFSQLMLCGADKVSINSAAIRNPNLISEAAAKFGSQAVVVAIDAKRNGDFYEIFTHGGRKGTGIDAVEWACRAQELGAGELLVTSMDRDGTKVGYDLGLLGAICSRVSIPVIASGGVGGLGDLVDGAGAGATGLLAASIFHFREFSIADAKGVLGGAGVLVR